MKQQPAYEKSDVSIKGVVWFTGVLALACAGIMVLIVYLMGRYELREARVDAASLPATRVPGAAPQRPAGPVLQGAPGSAYELQHPMVEMQAWDRQMDERLSSSGWVDRNAGVVRIPIAEAKRLVLERGLPVREGAPEEVPR
jgi:hypothetical protein